MLSTNNKIRLIRADDFPLRVSRQRDVTGHHFLFPRGDPEVRLAARHGRFGINLFRAADRSRICRGAGEVEGVIGIFKSAVFPRFLPLPLARLIRVDWIILVREI